MTGIIKLFHVTSLFQYPLKSLEKIWFFDVFRRHRKRPVVWNGLIAKCRQYWKTPFISINKIKYDTNTLRNRCPYLELLWSVFSPNAGKYGPE